MTGTAHGADFQGKLTSRVHHPWTKGSRSSSYPANRWLNPAGSREGDHAPFDRLFVGVRPDGVIEVRRDILEEQDGQCWFTA